MTDIIESAQRRVSQRLDKLKVKIHSKIIRALAREETPKFDNERKWIRGLGEIDDEGNLTLHETFKTWLE